MTTNGDMPPRTPGDRDTPGRVIRDDLDAVDDTVAKITDTEVEEQLRRILDQSGHAGPIPEQMWQDFSADQLSVLNPCGAPADASLIAVASQSAAEIISSARRRARLLEEKTRAAQESVMAARQEAEQVVADARAVHDAALEQAAMMIRDAREKAARIIDDAHADAEQIVKAARDRHGHLLATGGGAGAITQLFAFADPDRHPPATADHDYARLDACSVVGVSAADNWLAPLASGLFRPREEADLYWTRDVPPSSPPADPWQALEAPHHGARSIIQDLSLGGELARKTLRVLFAWEVPIDEIPGRHWLTSDQCSLPRLLAVPDSCGAQSAAFSPDDTRLATASDDTTARIWDTASGQQLTESLHDSKVTPVALSPDGTQLIAASDGCVRVWSVTHAGLGEMLSAQGRYSEAAQSLREAIPLRLGPASAYPHGRLGSVLSALVPASLSNLGVRYSALGRPADALPVTQEAVTTYRELAATSPDRYRPDLAASLDNLGIWYSALGRPADALPVEQEAVTIRRELAAASPDRYRPDLAASLSNLGITYSDLGRPADALPVAEEAVVIRRELAATSPDQHRPDVAESLRLLAAIHEELGQTDVAEEFRQEAAQFGDVDS